MQKTNQSFKTITEALLFMCKCSRRFSLISHKPLQLCYKMSAVSRFSAVLQIQKFNFVKSKQKFFWLRFWEILMSPAVFSRFDSVYWGSFSYNCKWFYCIFPWHLLIRQFCALRLFTHQKVATETLWNSLQFEQQGSIASSTQIKLLGWAQCGALLMEKFCITHIYMRKRENQFRKTVVQTSMMKTFSTRQWTLFRRKKKI